MLRDGAGDSLLSAMTVAVVQSVVETKCALFGKETLGDPKGGTGSTSVRAPRRKDARPLSTAKVGG